MLIGRARPRADVPKAKHLASPLTTWADRLSTVPRVLAATGRIVRLALLPLVNADPASDEWIHEVKVDGFRGSVDEARDIKVCLFTAFDS